MDDYQFQAVDQDTARGHNDVYQQVVSGSDVDVQEPQQPQHKAKFWHEVVAGGAGFEAMKKFEDHQRKEGKTVSHARAKELLAGFASAAVDRFAETKGEDWFDSERAKHDAKQQAVTLYDQQYAGQDNWDPNSTPHEYYAPQN
jgi:hypothetical protein